MKYFIILFICSLLIGNETNLGNLLSIAFENNNIIQSKKKLVTKQNLNAKISGSLPDPSLSVGYFLTPIETKTGPQEWKIGITQSIPGFGKLSSKKEFGLLEAENEAILLKKTQLELQRKVITAYENLHFQQTELEIAENLLEIYQNLETVMAEQYLSSTKSHSKLIQIQLEVLKQKDNLISIHNEKVILLKELEYLVGEEVSEEIKFNDEKLIIPIFNEIASNPEFQSTKILLNIAETKLYLAKLSYFPDFSLGADYISLGNSVENNPIDIRFGVTLPIWFGKNFEKISFANAEQASVEYLLSDIEESIKTQAERLSYKMENLRRRINLIDEELVPKSELSYKISETEYIANEIEFDELMDSIQILFNLQLERATAIQNFQITKARLLELIGEIL